MSVATKEPILGYVSKNDEIRNSGSKGLRGLYWAKMVKIIKFMFFVQKVSSGMGASHPKFLEG